MKIASFNDNDKNDLDSPGDCGMMVQVNHKEALALIESLSHQMLGGTSNSGRVEHFTEDGKYFSIAVVKEALTTSMI